MVPQCGVAVMKPVFLIGYMGCGKTTLGEVLARQMDLPYIDLDQYIEHQQGLSIVELFASKGENRFREIEAAALREVAAKTDVIVGCGMPSAVSINMRARIGAVYNHKNYFVGLQSIGDHHRYKTKTSRLVNSTLNFVALVGIRF